MDWPTLQMGQMDIYNKNVSSFSSNSFMNNPVLLMGLSMRNYKSNRDNESCLCVSNEFRKWWISRQNEWYAWIKHNSYISLKKCSKTHTEWKPTTHKNSKSTFRLNILFGWCQRVFIFDKEDKNRVNIGASSLGSY